MNPLIDFNILNMLGLAAFYAILIYTMLYCGIKLLKKHYEDWRRKIFRKTYY